MRLLQIILNPRIFLVILTVGLCIAPLSLRWLHAPNLLLFSIGAQVDEFLTPIPKPINNLVKITVTPGEMDRLVNDLPGAIQLGNLFQGLRGIYTQGVLVVLDELPDVNNYAADMLVNRLASEPLMRESLQNAGMLDEIEKLEKRQESFKTQVRDGALLLGVAHGNTPAQSLHYLRSSEIIKPQNTSAKDGVFQSLLVSMGWGTNVRSLTLHEYETKTLAFPFYRGEYASPSYPLLWQVEQGYYPDALLVLLKKSRGAAQLSGDSRKIILNDKPLLMSEGAMIYPVFSKASGMPDLVESIALSEFNNPITFQKLEKKTVMIGVNDSPAFTNAVSTFYSLQNDAYYSIPDWYRWAEKSGLLFLLFYLFWIIPLLRIKTGLIMSAVLASALLVSQVSLQISSLQWLPVGLLLSYLLLGHLFSLMWALQKKSLPEPARRPQRAADTGSRINAFKNSLFGKTNSRKEPRVPTGAFSLEKTMAFTRKDSAQPLTFGRYQIDSELGRGAMGVVYRGHDPKIARDVAIKTLNYSQFSSDELPDVKTRFFREAEAAGKLKHQNIVTVYDVGEDSERAFIAMDYVGGKPLSAYTKKDNLLPVDEVYWVIIQVAEALGYAHEHNIVHRDIKPSNILYDRDREEVKVADFGIARITNNASTRTGDILGSPLYMSPEQIKGEKVTGQSDIFSLGVTFYQLLTGELPFTGDSMVAITHQIVNGKFKAVTEVNPRLPESADRIVNKALQKNTEKRFESAYELSDVLQKYMGKN